MNKKNENPLEMVQAPKDPKPPPADLKKPEEETTKKEEVKTPTFELPSGYVVAQEMRELFDEDIVTHVQGPSEPEAD